MIKINILLTSAGGLTGTYLIKNYRRSDKYDCNIIAIDVNNDVPARSMADKFYCVPFLREKELYIDTVTKIIEENHIDVIIPITSRDVDFYSANNFCPNVKKMILDSDINDRLSNKKTCYDFLNTCGIKTPKVFDHPVEFPIFAKPTKGSGSKGTSKIIDNTDYIYWQSKYPESMFIEFLDGEECTVDCLFDNNGKCIGFHNRVRKKTISGGAVITVSKYEKKLESIIKILEDRAFLRGPINFQYIKTNDELYLIDFNTRFASGGLPLTVQCGFNIPEKLIDLLYFNSTETYRQTPDTDNITMIRYYEELFV